MKYGAIVKIHPHTIESMADPRATADPHAIVLGSGRHRQRVPFTRVKLRYNGKETEIASRMLTDTGMVAPMPTTVPFEEGV